MSDTQINDTEQATRRQREAQFAHEPGHAPHTSSDIGGLSQHAALSLIGGSYPARSNMAMRAQAIQQMQRTHGNRAVQRAAVQRSQAPTESLAVMEQVMGKDTPGFQWMRRQMGMEPGQAMHSLEALRKAGMEGPSLDYMARQTGMYGVEGKPNGPNAEYGKNEAGGFELKARADGDKRGGDEAELGFVEGADGTWVEDGGRQSGKKFKGGGARGKINEGGYVSGEYELGTIGGELSYGDNGFRAQAGATLGGASVTIGQFDGKSATDEQLKLGLSAGPSFGIRGHWGDLDKDGKREYGFGADIGIASFDFKTEDPLRSFTSQYNLMPGKNLTNEALKAMPSGEDMVKIASDPLGSALNYLNPFSGSDGPSEAEQQKNQADFIAKRDKELGDIEKNKEKIMKEKGPQAYYHMMTVANLPPQMRNLVEAAP